MEAGQLQYRQFTNERRQKRRRKSTSGLDPPSWKMAATLLFEVYGPSRAPIMSNFTPTTLKTPRQNYFRIAVAMLQNGRYQLSWLSVGPKDLVMLKNKASDVKNAVRILLPVWHPPSWKMAASLFIEVYGPSGVPIKSNFTLAPLKTQLVNYFRFAVAILQNGR